MSAVEMIKTAIARIKAAKEKLRTWLTNAGVTVPDGTKLDGMVDMLDDVAVASGDDFEITDASYLFYEGSRIDILDKILKKCIGIKKASYMFYNCIRIYTADLSGLDLTYLEEASSMFEGCTKLRNIIFGSSESKSINNMSRMFYKCYALKSIDLSKFDTSNVSNMAQLFCDCNMIEKIDFSTIETSSVIAMYSIFEKCVKLKEIIGFSSVNIKQGNIGFPKGSSSKRYSLKRLTFRNDLPDGKYAIRSAINISYCSMERSGFLEMIDTITDVSSLGLSASYTKITITGNPCVTGTLSDGTACDVLNDEDRSIATARGWTLVE